MRVTVTLPLNAARLKARQILDQSPPRGYVTVVEHWRRLPDGQGRIHDAAITNSELIRIRCITSKARNVGNSQPGMSNLWQLPACH
jgi:hypothetical protein